MLLMYVLAWHLQIRNVHERMEGCRRGCCSSPAFDEDWPSPRLVNPEMLKQPTASMCRGLIRRGSRMGPRIGGQTRLRVVGCASQGTASTRGGKRDRRNKLWRHPLQRHIEVPYRIAAAIAVMEMGVSEYSVIANAVGLTVEEVERVDMAEEPTVRLLALARIPISESFKLDNYVRCPKCEARVGIAPCVACRSFGRNHLT